MISTIMIKPEGMAIFNLLDTEPTFLSEEEYNLKEVTLNQLFREGLLSIQYPMLKMDSEHLIASGIFDVSLSSYNIMYGNLELDEETKIHLTDRLTTSKVAILTFNLPPEIDQSDLATWKGKIKSKKHEGKPTGLRKKLLEKLGNQQGIFDVDEDKTLNFIHTADTEEESFLITKQLIEEGQIFSYLNEEKLKEIEEGNIRFEEGLLI
jgi:hypothetical protein